MTLRQNSSGSSSGSSSRGSVDHEDILRILPTGMPAEPVSDVRRSPSGSDSPPTAPSAQPLKKPKGQKGVGRGRGGGRPPTACLQCRQRRTRCDQGKPCSNCRTRGEGSRCTLLTGSTENTKTSQELRSLVDKLEQVISPESTKPLYEEPQGSPQSGSRSVGNDIYISLNSNCMAAELSLSLIKDREGDLLARTPTDHLGAPPPPFPSPPASVDVREILSLLPTLLQSELTVKQYFLKVHPLVYAINRRKFLIELKTLLEVPIANQDLHWLSSYLLVCALGLLSMDAKDLEDNGFPQKVESELLARCWVDAAIKLLSLKPLSVYPTIDAVRTVNLLYHFWTGWSNGVHLLAAEAFTPTALGLIMNLDLNRDPTEVSGSLNAEDVEDRRRLFWGFFIQEALLSSMLSKSWSLINLSSVSVRFPTHASSPSESPSSSSTNLVDGNKNHPSYLSFQTSVCLSLNRIATTLFSKHAVPYSRLLERHSELEEIGTMLPNTIAPSVGGLDGEEYRRSLDKGSLLMVAFGFMYLHRPFLGLNEMPTIGGGEGEEKYLKEMKERGISIESHKEICVRHARIILSTCTPLSPTLPPFVSIFIYLSALITLATYLIRLTPSDPEFLSLHQEVLNHFALLNTSIISASKGGNAIPRGVIERAIRVVGVLLETHAQA